MLLFFSFFFLFFFDHGGGTRVYLQPISFGIVWKENFATCASIVIGLSIGLFLSTRERYLFLAIFFVYLFRDGLQPEMGTHFRTTSASETMVWVWVSTHGGKHKRSNTPKTAAQQHKPHQYCCVSYPLAHASGITTSRWKRIVLVPTTRTLALSSR